MRPRRFYIFFPPALVKWMRNGIEYGIGSIPLGGYVKIPGMHKPAAGDLEAHLEPALDGGAVARALRRAGASRRSTRSDLDDARAELPDLGARSSGSTSPSAPAGPPTAASPTSTTRSRPTRTGARRPGSASPSSSPGPRRTSSSRSCSLAVVFMLGVPTGVDAGRWTRSTGSPAAAMGLQPGDEIVAVNGRSGEPDDLAERSAAARAKPVDRHRVRDGDRLQLEGTPKPEQDEDVYRLGFAFGLDVPEPTARSRRSGSPSTRPGR